MVPKKPNIVFITADQLRGDWLGCNGHNKVLTPQLDQLSYSGINFQRASSDCPTCVPARRILMTGKNSYNIHMNSNKDLQPFPEGPKLAELITKAGYQSYAVGKLHTCPQRSRIGFEEVILNEEGRHHGDLTADDYEKDLAKEGMAHLIYSHGLGNNQYGARISPIPEHLTTTSWTARRAAEFIERRDPTRPFFLHVSFDKPHPPLTPPKEYWDLYEGTQFDAPVMGKWLEKKKPNFIEKMRLNHNWDDLQRNDLPIQQSLRAYAALITQIDSKIGFLLGTLTENKLLDNTWVIFASDHGDALFDHGNFAKSDFFKGSCGIPLIIKPANSWFEKTKQKPGIIDNKTPAGLVDILPTLCQIAEANVPENCDGSSLLELFDSRKKTSFRPYSFGNCGAIYMVTNGTLKYIWYAADEIELLFDTQNDPNDLCDLADEPKYAKEKSILRSELIDWMNKHKDPILKDKVLTKSPHDWNLSSGKSSHGWANRGIR